MSNQNQETNISVENEQSSKAQATPNLIYEKKKINKKKGKYVFRSELKHVLEDLSFSCVLNRFTGHLYTIKNIK